MAILAGALLSMSIAGPVAADAGLVSSSPADKAVTTTPPTTVTLSFDEGLDPAKSSFKLIRDGATIGTGTVSAGSAKVMELEGLLLAPGGYEVRWTAGSTDGHLVRGTLTFTVADPTPEPSTPAPATPEPSAVATEGPATPALASTPAPASTLPPDDATPAATSTADVLVPIVVGLVAVAAIGLLVLRRSRKA